MDVGLATLSIPAYVMAKTSTETMGQSATAACMEEAEGATTAHANLLAFVSEPGKNWVWVLGGCICLLLMFLVLYCYVCFALSL